MTATAIAPANVKLNNWHELLTAVESNQGVHRVTMETLRQLEGRQRVGKHILKEIEEKLATLGLGHLPEELPNRQQQPVLLYRLGTPASEAVQAIRNGLTESPSESAFRVLHRLNALPDPETVVSREEVSEAAKDATRAVLGLLLQVSGPESVAGLSEHNGNGANGRVDITELLTQLR